MKCLLVCAVALAAISLSSGRVAKPAPSITDEFINLINSKQSTWKAGRNFVAMPSLNALVGVLPKTDDQVKLPVKTHGSHTYADIPESFDAREQWTECADVIGNIRDQSACGSCWAIAAVEAMSDRICIHSNATIKLSLSTNDLMTCCTDCGKGCNGGWLSPSWKYWETTGIVTGGSFENKEGCQSYPFASCEHHVTGSKPPCGDLQSTPACKKTCDDASVSFEDSLTTGSAYMIANSVAEIQKEIMTNGPVECSFEVYEDFLTYKEGVYQHVAGGFAGSHAMKIVGWGVEEGTPYWLIANSWNPDWGSEGYIKFLRGQNHLGIEADINAGIPNL